MARRTKVFTGEDGRDQGKLYLITEMPATQAEMWAARAFLAISRSGVDLPEGFSDSGFAGIAKLGITLFSKISFEEACILLGEMFGCVKALPNPDNISVVRPLVEDDIEEVGTRLKLRAAIFRLHADF